MPKLKLYSSVKSPYARKVRIVLAEKQIAHEFIETSAAAPGSPVPKINPLGKVPVMVVDDETVLYDSGVIAEYLDMLVPLPSLLPAGGMERVKVRRWDALGQGICDAAVEIVHERNRPVEAQRSPERIAKQRIKVENGLAAAEREIGDREWCHGSALSLGDIALVMAMGWITLRLPDIEWQGKLPRLAAYQARLEQRASFRETAVPELAAAMAAAMQRVVAAAR